MRVVRVGPLSERAIDAAAEFQARVVPEVLRFLPGTGRGTTEGGGEVPGASASLESKVTPHLPLHHPTGGSPPPAGEALALVFPPTRHDHRGWRLAVVQDLARAAAPVRVNGVVGDNEAAIAETLAYLAAAPGITGQLLAV